MSVLRAIREARRAFELENLSGPMTICLSDREFRLLEGELRERRAPMYRRLPDGRVEVYDPPRFGIVSVEGVVVRRA